MFRCSGSGTGTLTALVAGAKTKSTTVTCAATASTTWAVSALLKSESKHFCVDSTGTAKATTSAITSSTCGF